jgi:hypothetical protein
MGDSRVELRRRQIEAMQAENELAVTLRENGTSPWASDIPQPFLEQVRCEGRHITHAEVPRGAC